MRSLLSSSIAAAALPQVALVALFACVGCAGSSHDAGQPTRAASLADSSASTRAIAVMLDDWHDAAAKADEARYFAHLADDSVFLGTDATERWTKKAFATYAHPHFAKKKAWSFHAVRRAITVDGLVAHFDEDLATEKLGPARGSGVVAFRNGAWVILQYNLALTIPNDRFAEAHEAVTAMRLAGDGGPLESLAWLAGVWVTEKDGERTEELWTAPEGKTMLGVARTIRGGKTTFFEALRIEARPEGVVLVARPSGQDEAEFRLVNGSGGTAAVFENPSHDFPRRIAYQCTDDELVAKIDGGGATSEWRYRRAIIATTR